MNGERSVSVLLVDDNEQWARFLARELERQPEGYRVSVATSANEALQRYLGTEDYDCVVTDYQMPDATGLQLVNWIQKSDHDVPVILHTGVGNEDLAAEAIRAGASDYIIKNPKADQTSLFTRRIENTINQHRIELSIKESEERYRTVTEQSTDVILIIQNGIAVFCNQRFYDLLEYTESDLEAFDLVTEIVHPDDREHVRTVISEWDEKTDIDPLQEARVRTANGELRYWELAGQRITYEEKPAILVSARDITERKRRNRELEWERDLNHNVQKALIDTKTPKELLEAVCEQLHEYGYDLAWSGRVLDDELQPEAVRGDEPAYVSDATFALEGAYDSEPSVLAARTREPQVINDFEDLFATKWRDTAIEAGYRSGAAFPLLHENVFYGVLSVYDRQVDRFDETECTLLESLADTVAFTIHSFETRHALSARHAVELVFGLPGPTYYLVEIAWESDGGVDDGTITVDGTVRQDANRVLQYVTIPRQSRETFFELATEHPSVESVTPVTEDGERFKLVVTEPTPESKLAEMGGVVRETVIDRTGAEIRVEAPTRRDARKLVERIRNEYPRISLRTLTDIDRERSPSSPPGFTAAELTDKQREAHRVAYFEGYFENPRESNATEVAESIGVSHSTFLQHLRAAQKKLARDLYE